MKQKLNYVLFAGFTSVALAAAIHVPTFGNRRPQSDETAFKSACAYDYIFAAIPHTNDWMNAESAPIATTTGGPTGTTLGAQSISEDLAAKHKAAKFKFGHELTQQLEAGDGDVLREVHKDVGGADKISFDDFLLKMRELDSSEALCPRKNPSDQWSKQVLSESELMDIIRGAIK